MKNITVTVPEDVYRAARIRAAEHGRSLSAMVAEYLQELSSNDDNMSRLEELQERVQAEITSFRAGDRLERDQVHDRALH